MRRNRFVTSDFAAPCTALILDTIPRRGIYGIDRPMSRPLSMADQENANARRRNQPPTPASRGRVRYRRDRPGLRHEGRSGHVETPFRPRRPDLSLLLGALPRKILGGPQQLPHTNGRTEAGTCEGNDLHLPDAPRDPA